MNDTDNSGREQSAAFETTYKCRNCGNEWTDDHPPQTVVEKSTGLGRVVVKSKDCDKFITEEDCGCCYIVCCPVCELSNEVTVADRAPIQDGEFDTDSNHS